MDLNNVQFTFQKQFDKNKLYQNKRNILFSFQTVGCLRAIKL